MNESACIILQARMASQRLPFKALARVDGRTILEQCLRRLAAGASAPVVLATTDRRDDDVLAAVAERAGARVFRGSERDVLDRYRRCADWMRATYVIRATADNPCVDVDAPRRVLAALIAERADYVSEKDLPYGGGVEGVTAAALRRAAAEAVDDYDHEHVTPFVRRRLDLFSQVQLDAPAALARPDVRVTVDTAADLAHVRTLYARTGADMPSLRDLIAAADQAASSYAA